MGRGRIPAVAALAGAGAAAAGWLAALRADRRAIAADPEHALLADPPRGRELQVVSADGTTLHAEVFGPDGAPTIVLAHGWTCALRFWAYQLRDLPPDVRVVAYDQRGHGRSATPESRDYSTDAFAADLDAVLRRAVPEGERPVVAGHSLGGMTIVAWAQARGDSVADRIAGAALVCTGMGDLVSESLVLRAPPGLGRVHAAAGRVMLSASAPLPKGSTPISHRAVKYVALSPGASPARVAFCEELVLECRRDVRAATGGTLTRLDLMDGLDSLDVPTVVIAGERDRLTPPAHAERMAAALPRLERIVEVPGAGHMSPVEAPEVVTRELRALVDAATRPDGAATARPAAGPPGRSAR